MIRQICIYSNGDKMKKKVSRVTTITRRCVQLKLKRNATTRLTEHDYIIRYNDAVRRLNDFEKDFRTKADDLKCYSGGKYV